jgi:hypothetical protein
MPAINFKKQHAARIRSGEKTCTIRKNRTRNPCPGDTLHLYTGMRTPHCLKLGEATCSAVTPIEIHDDGVLLANLRLSARALAALARRDGFDDWPAMRNFFEEVHGLPFTGAVLIEWSSFTPSASVGRPHAKDAKSAKPRRKNNSPIA